MKTVYASILAVAVMVCCLGVILEWGSPTQPIVQMNPVTAFILMLTALSFCLRRRDFAVWVATISLLVVLHILISYVSGYQSFDQLIFLRVLNANRMAPNTAIVIALIDVGIFCKTLRGTIGGLVIAVGLSAIAGYFLRIPDLYQMASSIPMSIKTAYSVILLGASLLLYRQSANKGEQA